MSKSIKIVKIIDEFTLVINVGLNDGISQNFEFLIYEIGEELFDPDTNISLGNLETIKGTGSVIHIQENMTTIKSNMYDYKEDKKIIRKSGNGLASFSFLGIGTEEIIEPKEKTIKPFDNPKVGDFIKITNKKNF